jgi:hypothetical protein
MIIHACSEADFRENIFSSNFPSVFVFQCEASGQYPLASGQVRLRWPDGQVTRPDASGLVALRVRTGPHRVLYCIFS